MQPVQCARVGSLFTACYKQPFALWTKGHRSTGLGTASWPLVNYFGMPAIDAEAENLAGQVFDAGD